jgi:hypothetical protein
MSGSNNPLAPFTGTPFQPTQINIFSTSPGVFAPAIGLFGPAYTASAASFTGIDPTTFASALLSFQEAGAANLATVSNEGAALYEGNNQLFATWANYQNNFLTTIGNDFTTAVNKSAVACSGFFSCLF